MSSTLWGILVGVVTAAAVLAGGSGWRLLQNWAIERQRQIFRFWDGKRIRAADPLHVLRALRADPEYTDTEHLKPAANGDDDARRIVASATRRAFGLAELADGGLSDLECLAILSQFLHWTRYLKKNTARPQNSPETSEPQFSDESTTKPESESGSTSTESKPAEQGAC